MASRGKLTVLIGAVAAAGVAVAAFMKRERIAHLSGKAREKVGGLAGQNGSTNDVDQRSKESFPASDAPGYGPGVI